MTRDVSLAISALTLGGLTARKRFCSERLWCVISFLGGGARLTPFLLRDAVIEGVA